MSQHGKQVQTTPQNKPQQHSGSGEGGGVMDSLLGFFRRDAGDPSPAHQALANPNSVLDDIDINDLDIRQSPGGSKFFSQYGLKIKFNAPATEKLIAFREQLSSGMADLKAQLAEAQRQLKAGLPSKQ